jgi:Cu2+-exporting ATPase
MQAMMYASALWFGAFDDAGAATRDLFRWLTLLVATPVVFYSAGPFFAGALRLLAARRLGMDVPVALAVALIYAGSVVEVVTGGPDVWFESVSMFVLFLLAGRYLEMRARHRAGELSDALARLTPVVRRPRRAGWIARARRRGRARAGRPRRRRGGTIRSRPTASSTATPAASTNRG